MKSEIIFPWHNGNGPRRQAKVIIEAYFDLPTEATIFDEGEDLHLLLLGKKYIPDINWAFLGDHENDRAPHIELHLDSCTTSLEEVIHPGDEERLRSIFIK